jgi:hypothetical protein
MPTTTTIDFSPLLKPSTPEEVAAFKAKAKADGVRWATWNSGTIIALVLVIPVALGIVAIGFGLLTFGMRATLSSQNPGTAVIPLIFFLGFLGLVTFLIVGAISSHAKRWERWERLTRFARQNGMAFSPNSLKPSYPGAIFQIGDTRQSVDHFVSTAGRFFDFGNYRYSTGSGKNRSTRVWGFLAFNLDRRLPHMMLDSKANNGFFGTNLPANFDKGQILSLEGDFDKYFTLYCPKEYERDALYVFTPDLMALLIDEAAPFDVEIVDNWMFVYSNVAFQPGDANLYARLFRIMDTVGAKALTQTDHYVDARVGDFTANIVAPGGARLKRRVSVGAIVIAVVFVGLWIWGILGDGLYRFLG